MAPDSPYKVSMDDLDAVRVPVDEQVEERQPTPSERPLSAAAERERQDLAAGGGPVSS